jgi:dihydropyrimidinase
MLITGGTVVTANGEQRADVRIDGGQVVEVALGLAAAPGEQVIDAADKYVLPGGVDPHTHMDLLQGRLRASDSFRSGTIAAACGGTTTIIDHMAFGPPGCNLMHQVEVYHALADGQAVVDFGLHGVVDHVDTAILDELPQLLAEGITSLKFYMTYANRLDDLEILRLLECTGALGMLACVHCENDAVIEHLRSHYSDAGLTTPHYPAASRPPAAEAEAAYRAAALAHVAGDAPLYIVHTSAAQTLEALAALDANLATNRNLVLETCPQYLTLDAAAYDAPGDDGLKYIMSPPLRNQHDRDALWQALRDGLISTIGSDHCPFPMHDKLLGQGDFSKCPNGAPTVELRYPILLALGRTHGLTLPRIVDLCATAPARIFGLYPQKGTIAPGSDADLVLYDAERPVTVTHSILHENVDYTPFEGLELQGYPTMTISRGTVVARDGQFCGPAGHGRYLHRSL